MIDLWWILLKHSRTSGITETITHVYQQRARRASDTTEVRSLLTSVASLGKL